ncbi:MAG: UDP-glucuronic acid decarboxylase family protein [Dehalococcoidia bacterium]|nr:SDR family oxidoreductase [Dehalococcoidia bacterium]MCB9486900.1 SDR family oxidoreductase [Thermoflexaceae bacterium]
MPILVAGGAGFIGSHLSERLLRDGHDVWCIDNLLTGRLSNLASFKAQARFHFRQWDVVAGLPPELPRMDRVYHLASPASPPGYKVHPVATMRSNSEGTRHMLERCQRDGARFLFASTSEAYGDPEVHPQFEDYRGNVSSTGPRSMYDESKRFGEAMTMVFTRDHEVDARIARIFNTYGPRSDPHDGRLVPNFVRQCLLNEPITVYGDGSQTRSLCYVDDLVEGLVALMETPGTTGEVVNLGNPEEHTILEFAEVIVRLTRSRSTVVHTDFAVGDDPQRRQPDITKARAMLGWNPAVALNTGLKRTIEAFAAELGLPDFAEVA